MVLLTERGSDQELSLLHAQFEMPTCSPSEDVRLAIDNVSMEFKAKVLARCVGVGWQESHCMDVIYFHGKR